MYRLECQDEKIHLCGAIQNFGSLLVFEDYRCIAASENIQDLLNFEIANLRNLHLQEILHLLIPNQEWNLREIEDQIANDVFFRHVTLVELNSDWYYLSIYRYNDCEYLELEIAGDNDTNSTNLFYYAHYVEANNHNIWQSLTVLIKKIINFDRVMIYRFEEDGSGRVIAESKEKDMSSLLGFRYPEFDIPSQARELYLQFLARHVQDVDAPTHSIVSFFGKNIDLSKSSLRALSPIHLQYLRNADVKSSASFSIVIEGRLWGLVTCQSKEPSPVYLTQRHLAVFLTQYVTNYYLAQKRKFINAESSKMKSVEQDIKAELLLNSNVLDILKKFAPQIKSLVKADGVLIKHEHGDFIWGEVPSKQSIRYLNDSLSPNETFFYTSNWHSIDDSLHLGELFPGVIRLKLLASLDCYIYLFRKEREVEEIWAGNPEKLYTYDSSRDIEFASPRTSFEAWRSITKGKSEKWKSSELNFIEKISIVTNEAIAHKSAEIERLNKELVRSNNALDTFGYTLTHDLKNPVSSIQLAAQMILRTRGASPILLEKLATNILEGATLIIDMADKVHKLAKTNSVPITMEIINPYDKIASIVEGCKQQYQNSDLEVVIGEIYPIKAEKTLVYQLFLNLIGNAIKYSSREARPVVEIFSLKTDSKVHYYIVDNGIGMNLTENQDIFEIFKRLPNSSSFDGSGIGLSIVKRIVDKLNAEITVESQVGKGSRFCVTFSLN